MSRQKLAVPIVLAIIVVSVLALSAFSPLLENPRNLYPVDGQVKLDGVPLSNATILFVPLQTGNGAGLPAAVSYGKTGESGAFSIKTSDGLAGAVQGFHRVYISKRQAGSEANGTTGLTKKPEHGSGPTTADIGELVDQPRDLFATNSGPVTELVPVHYNLETILTYRVEAGGNRVANFDLTSTDPWLNEFLPLPTDGPERQETP